MIFIYAYQNKRNGKIYIGQTGNLIRRDHAHITNSDKSMHIDRAIKKYGRDNFDLWIIKNVDTQEQADYEEIYWISEMRRLLGNKAVYNISNGGGAPMRGRKHTKITKKQMSKSAIGKDGTNIGKTFDDEWKLSMSKSQAGKSQISKRRFSEEIEKEICRLYLEEKSMYALGKQFECQRTTISDILRRYNIKIRQSNYTGHSNGKNIFSLEQEKEICDLYLLGSISRTKLSQKFNCGKTTIRKILLRHRIKL